MTPEQIIELFVQREKMNGYYLVMMTTGSRRCPDRELVINKISKMLRSVGYSLIRKTHGTVRNYKYDNYSIQRKVNLSIWPCYVAKSDLSQCPHKSECYLHRKGRCKI